MSIALLFGAVLVSAANLVLVTYTLIYRRYRVSSFSVLAMALSSLSIFSTSALQLERVQRRLFGVALPSNAWTQLVTVIQLVAAVVHLIAIMIITSEDEDERK